MPCSCQMLDVNQDGSLDAKDAKVPLLHSPRLSYSSSPVHAESRSSLFISWDSPSSFSSPPPLVFLYLPLIGCFAGSVEEDRASDIANKREEGRRKGVSRGNLVWEG